MTKEDLLDIIAWTNPIWVELPYKVRFRDDFIIDKGTSRWGFHPDLKDWLNNRNLYEGRGRMKPGHRAWRFNNSFAFENKNDATEFKLLFG